MRESGKNVVMPVSRRAGARQSQKINLPDPTPDPIGTKTGIRIAPRVKVFVESVLNRSLQVVFTNRRGNRAAVQRNDAAFYRSSINEGSDKSKAHILQRFVWSAAKPDGEPFNPNYARVEPKRA